MAYKIFDTLVDPIEETKDEKSDDKSTKKDSGLKNKKKEPEPEVDYHHPVDEENPRVEFEGK